MIQETHAGHWNDLYPLSDACGQVWWQEFLFAAEPLAYVHTAHALSIIHVTPPRLLGCCQSKSLHRHDVAQLSGSRRSPTLLGYKIAGV